MHYQAHLSALATAAAMSELVERADGALAALLPGFAYRLHWIADPANSALPDEEALAGLAAGTAVPDRTSASTLVPIRAAGELLGWVSVHPTGWSAEQDLGLTLFTAVLGPAYLAMRRAPPPPLTQQKAALGPRIAQLHSHEAVTLLASEICDLIFHAIPFRNIVCILRYRDSEWNNLACVRMGDQVAYPRIFWKSDSGLSSMVMLTGAPIYTSAYRAECERLGVSAMDDLTPTPIQAWMGIPLFDNTRVFGALVAYSERPNQLLSPDEQELFRWIVTEVSPLLLSARRYERAAEEARSREALNRIARAINSSLDPEYVPTLIVERAPALLNAEEASLLLLDESTGELVFQYAAGPAGNRLLGQRLPPRTGIAGFVVESGRAEIVNDTRADGRFYRNLDTNTGFTTRSILAVPLRGLDGVKGVIEVLNRHDNAPFTHDDLALLEALADQAIIALENAQRFASVDQALTRRAQELDRTNDRLRTMLRATNTVRAERQLDHLLPQIAGAIARSSGFRCAAIALVQRERVPRPIIKRASSIGNPATSPPEAGAASMLLHEFEALLHPESLRGTLTYLIEQGRAAIVWLADSDLPVTPTEVYPGSWQPGDALVCLLRDSRGRLLGALGFDDPDDGLRPSLEQVQILEILANQAAAAIENAYLYTEQQSSLNRMLALNGLGRAISTTLRAPRQIFELTASGMQELSDARWAVVYLSDPTTGEHGEAIQIGRQPANPAASAQLAREAALVRRPITRTPADDGEFIVGIPLRGSVQTLGTICVGYETGLPGSTEIETLLLFASQAATAVESMRLSAEVREGRDQLASIMASTHEGLLLVDDEGRIAVANEAFLQLTDAEHWDLEVTGMAVGQFLQCWHAEADFPPTELEQFVSCLAAVAEGLESFQRGQLSGTRVGARALEWTILRATRQGDASAILPDPDTHRWRILLTVRDITAQKEAERLRTDLTNMMIHDLRSPLTSVMSAIDMFFRDGQGAISQHQRDILTIAHTSAKHLLHMVSMLLDISKLEGGSMPLDRNVLAVEGLATRAAGRMRVIADNKAVKFELQLDPEASHVYADEELILRVLQNLLDNALKFSPRGSTIWLCAENAPATEAAPPDAPETEGAPFRLDPRRAIRLAVRDRGTGVRPGDVEKIFTKFSQGGNRRKAGSGLGLTFCKLVVEAHGGRIWVESVLGAGSTFFFTLPAAIMDDDPPLGS